MGKGSDGEYGHVGTHSLPLVLITSVKYGNLPAEYNYVKCVCICEFDVLICVQLCNHYLDTIMFHIFMVTNLDTGKFQF